MNDYSLSTLMVAAFVAVQAIGKWWAIRAAKLGEERELYANLNDMVESLKKRVKELEAREKKHQAELTILRPIAAQVPVLESQIRALQKTLAIEIKPIAGNLAALDEIIGGTNGTN
jgi:uncharacterized protein involved in exopolysaccharide biosynthesis